MADHLDPLDVAWSVSSGPASKFPDIGSREVIDLAESDPNLFDRALDALYYRFASTMYESGSPDVVKKYRDFTDPWITRVGRDASEFFMGALDAYDTAWAGGMDRLAWDGEESLAKDIAQKLRFGESDTVEPRTMARWLLRGQVESVYSRDQAGETLTAIRQSRHRDLLQRASWDAGALSYLNETELAEANGHTTMLRPEASWMKLGTTDNPYSVVVTLTPEYLRTYGPTLLFSAQQTPDVDLVILLCTDEATANVLNDEADQFLRALSSFNRQPLPQNVTMLSVATPEWVKDVRAYYACGRLMAVPDLLKYFDSIYCVDPNVVLRSHPASFMSSTAHLTVSARRTGGPLSVSPWRRFHMESLVFNAEVLRSEFLDHLLGYVYRGLQIPAAYGLERNAMTYAMDQTGGTDFSPLNPYSKPAVVSEFSRTWIENFRRHNPGGA